MTKNHSLFAVVLAAAACSQSQHQVVLGFSAPRHHGLSIIGSKSLTGDSRQRRLVAASSSVASSAGDTPPSPSVYEEETETEAKAEAEASTPTPTATASSAAEDSTDIGTIDRRSRKKQERAEMIRAEGGRLAFDTKFGALNPYAIYYGLTSIVLGLVWFVALSTAQLFYFVTRNRFDKKRRIPVFLSHVWGTLLLRMTRNFPVMENRDVLLDFYKQQKAAMFVANHNSWMDIPFLGATIGWRNYKFVAKKELERVPILGKAIMCAKNVCVDRSDRRSQLMTLKAGMNWLKEGVHLTTFPEGTRSRSGKLMKFKNGAFKMAHKMQAPVVPLSIVASAKIMPSHWMFPFRPGRSICKVVVHDPVESDGKTEEELAEAVREAIISGLPEDQRP